MSGNKSFSRSMNGINNIEINEVQFPDGSTITSASNIVQLDTTNDFTSNNSFNSNLPTSTKEHDVEDLTAYMILNKQNADKLYTGTDTNNFITSFSRNGTTGVITLQQADTGVPITTETYTSITDAEISAIGDAVLKTTAQEIDGVKTFVDFPEIKKVGEVVPDPTTNEQFATKKYVDDNGGTGDAVLNGGTTQNPQTFTEFNKFDKELKLGGDLIFTEQGIQNMNFTNTSSAAKAAISQNTNRNWIYQTIAIGGTTNNQFNQIGIINDTGITNQIFQDKAQTNNIIQDGVNNNFIQRDGTATISQTGSNSTITTAGKMTCATVPSSPNDLCNKTYVDGQVSSGTTKAWAISGHSSPAINMNIGTGTYFPSSTSYVYTHYNYGGLWNGLQATIDQDGLYYICWEAFSPINNQSSRPSIYVNNSSGSQYKSQHRGKTKWDAGNSVSAVLELDVGDTVSIRTQVGLLSWYNNNAYNMCYGYLLKAL